MDGCDVKSKVKAGRLLHIVHSTCIEVIKTIASRNSRHPKALLKDVYFEESAGFSHAFIELLVIGARFMRQENVVVLIPGR